MFILTSSVRIFIYRHIKQYTFGELSHFCASFSFEISYSNDQFRNQVLSNYGQLLLRLARVIDWLATESPIDHVINWMIHLID